MMNSRNVAGLACALTLLICIGCNGGEQSDIPSLEAVTGTIKMDGKPLVNVTITFTSEAGQVSYATTDGEGKYELTYRGDHKGAELGMHTVTVETILEAPPGPDYKDPIPAKYNTESTLTAAVGDDENQVDFDLKSK